LLLDVNDDCCGVLGVVIEDDVTGEVDERFSNCCDELRFDLNEVEDFDEFTHFVKNHNSLGIFKTKKIILRPNTP